MKIPQPFFFCCLANRTVNLLCRSIVVATTLHRGSSIHGRRCGSYICHYAVFLPGRPLHVSVLWRLDGENAQRNRQVFTQRLRQGHLVALGVISLRTQITILSHFSSYSNYMCTNLHIHSHSHGWSSTTCSIIWRPGFLSQRWSPSELVGCLWVRRSRLSAFCSAF